MPVSVCKFESCSGHHKRGSFRTPPLYSKDFKKFISIKHVLSHREMLILCMLMKKIFYEKVVSYGANGFIKNSYPPFSDYVSIDELLETWIFSYKGFIEGANYARQCCSLGNERDAITIYWGLWRGLARTSTLSSCEMLEIRKKIVHGFSLLYFSLDEYVWEESSHFYEELHALESL